MLSRSGFLLQIALRRAAESRGAPVLLRPMQIFRLHSASKAITGWSKNPRESYVRPPGWSGRTNHLSGRNSTRFGRALVSSPVMELFKWVSLRSEGIITSSRLSYDHEDCNDSNIGYVRLTYRSDRIAVNLLYIPKSRG